MISKIVIASDLYKRAALQTEADRMRESFHEFAERAWREVDNSKFILTKFHDLLLSELHDWASGEVEHKRRMMLGVPPREGKTKFANVIAPAWIWTREPGESILGYGSTGPLVTESNRLMRRLIESKWYQERFCQDWQIDKSQRQKGQFATTAGGIRKAIGGRGSPTGWGGNIIIVDDPLDLNPRKPPPSDDDLNAACEAVQYLFNSRVNDPKAQRLLMIMQRSHERDPMGLLLQTEPEKWYKVFFDAVCDHRMPHRHPMDTRAEGEVLCPERGQSRESLEAKKTALGSDRYNAQYQQMPAAAGGMVVKPEWLQRYELGEDPDTSYTIVSWDCAFKGKSTSSWVVGSVWGVEAPDDPHRRRFVLLDLVREHLDYAATKRAIERLSLRWPDADLTIIEDKANGPALLSELRHKIPTTVGFNPAPFGDKVQRLQACSPLFEAGKVWIPVDGAAPWIDEYIAELTRFPKYATNDQVDSTTQVMLSCTQQLSELLRKVASKETEYFEIDW